MLGVSASVSVHVGLGRRGVVGLVTETLRTSFSSIVAWALVLVCGGCGPSAFDGEARPSSPSMANTGHFDGMRPLGSPLIESVSASRSTFNNGEGRAALSGELEERTTPSDTSIPQTITNGLNSSDAQVRYRALDHWEVTGSHAPLDLVFEAMEDEDEAVRAKAEAIVEQRWAAEQEHNQEHDQE